MMMSSIWDKMSLNDRIVSCHVDISNNALFATLSGVVYVGDVKLDEAIITAATDGRNVIYAPSFIQPLSRKQLRFLVLHEAMHKALHHCTTYKSLCEKYPALCNQAMDYVVNGTLEETDPQHTFIEHPTSVAPLLDKKYFGWSFVEVLQDLIKECEEAGGDPTASGDGGALDGHILGAVKEALKAKNEQEISDALHQGKMLAKRIQERGTGRSGSALDKLTQKRDTNWRDHLREFVTQLCEGDDYSRFAPPNKRLLPQGILMPSHFSESTGELVVACDTSGSMYGLYGTVFGEIARICENVKPEQVRVLWWECDIEGEQIFKPQDYHRIPEMLQPKGGGGTRLTCVSEYFTQHKLKPKACIVLSDGYIESDYVLPDCPILFGVVDNDHFTSNKGKTVRIYS
jgi:predicted metal-dependent peptidase